MAADKLRAFLVRLATDHAALGQYVKDPEGTMASGDLDPEDISALRSGVPALIYARLSGQSTMQTGAPAAMLVVDVTPGQGAAADALNIRATQASQQQPLLWPQGYPIYPPQQIYPQIHPIYPPPQIYPQIHPIQVIQPPIYPQIHPIQVIQPPIYPQIHPIQVIQPPIYPQIHPIYPQQLVVQPPVTPLLQQG